MKKTLCAICAILIGAANADAKMLVAYYSRSGNTKSVAELIRDTVGADIFEIKTADANHYPNEYDAAIDVAQTEVQNKNYPSIMKTPDISQYDTVFVGTPCWWGTMAGPVHTFLTTVDLSGKTVIPFNTHAGSGAGTVHNDISALTPNSVHLNGIAIYGNNAANSGDEIKTWLTEIKVIENAE